MGQAARTCGTSVVGGRPFPRHPESLKAAFIAANIGKTGSRAPTLHGPGGLGGGQWG